MYEHAIEEYSAPTEGKFPIECTLVFPTIALHVCQLVYYTVDVADINQRVAILMEGVTMKYMGPSHLQDDMQIALESLAGQLKVTITHCATHTLYEVDGLNDGQDLINAIAVYLVGAVSSCIGYSMKIRRALFQDADDIARNLSGDVESVIFANNNLTEDERNKERDPWLWEGISHLLFHLAVDDHQRHPPGTVVAKSYIHLKAKDHGLDVVVLYGPTPLGISVGECKAYLQRASDGIDDAALRLAEVDANARDGELRQVVSQMWAELPDEVRQKISDAFWRNERAYFPMVCCDREHSVDWKRKRVNVERLKVPIDRKYLVPAAIPAAKDFFDKVSDAMRAYAQDQLR